MPTQQPIRKALNQAFRKLAIERASFERFRRGVRELLDGVAAKPDE
jgi:hypothetical protein